jgi:hypothetical protein
MVAEKTGWTKKQILNDYSFAELNMMMADAPRLTKKKKEAQTFNSDDDLSAWFGITPEENG